jgi:CBS domain-containing protein
MDIYAPLSEIMTHNLTTVNPKDSLKEIKEIFEANNFHHLPVVRHREIVGLVSSSDLLLFRRKRFVEYDNIVEEGRLQAFRAEDIMTTKLAKLSSTDSIASALKVFAENLFHAIPIVDNGELVGMVTTFDVIKGLLARQPDNKTV